jgi:exopolyphosphatase/guanosine-5'-triphosphate,3'-diphosphate pyrophosphatase
VRLLQQIEASHLSREQFKDHLKDTLQSALRLLDSELSLKNIKNIVLVGGEARIVGREAEERTHAKFVNIKPAEFLQIVQKFESTDFDALTRYLNISYEESSTLMPTLQAYCQILSETGALDIYIPNASIREGMILSLSDQWSPKKQKEFLSQVCTSAGALAQKFNSDIILNKMVAEISGVLFDSTTSLHCLSAQSRLLLEVASITHDIGKGIHHSAYHKHGEYILMNTEIFGVSHEQMQVVANIVRYHRKSAPMPNHPNYVALSREDRLIVLKLCALLRVSVLIALFVKNVKTDLEISLSDEELLISCRHLEPHDARLISAKKEWALFEDVFGIGINLKTLNIW